MITFREKNFDYIPSEGAFATPELSEAVGDKLKDLQQNIKRGYRRFKTNPGRAIRNGVGTAIARPDVALQLVGDKAITVAHPAYAAVPVSLTMASPVTGDMMNTALSAGPLKKHRIPAKMRIAKQHFTARPGSPASGTNLAKVGQGLENGINKSLKFLFKRR